MASEELKNLKEKLKSFEKEKKQIKKDFVKLIKNKKIPLQERWDFWVGADESLKDHEGSIVSGDQTKGGQAWDRCFEMDMDRGSCDVADRIQWRIDDMIDEEDEEYDEEDDYNWSKQDVHALMEYALKLNVKSFDWDW